MRLSLCLSFQFQFHAVNPAHWDPAHLESRYPANELDSGCFGSSYLAKIGSNSF